MGNLFRYASVSAADTDGPASKTYQLAEIDAYLIEHAAELSELELAGFFYDPYLRSGKRFSQRPGSIALWRRIRSGDTLVVSTAMYAFSSADDLAEALIRAQRMDVIVHLVREGFRSDSRIGEQAIRLLESVERRGNRLIQKPAPVGWAYPNQRERDICQAMCRFFDSGCSIAQIAERLERSGVPRIRDHEWTDKFVGQCLRAAWASFPEREQTDRLTAAEAEALRAAERGILHSREESADDRTGRHRSDNGRHRGAEIWTPYRALPYAPARSTRRQDWRFHEKTVLPATLPECAESSDS